MKRKVVASGPIHGPLVEGQKECGPGKGRLKNLNVAPLGKVPRRQARTTKGSR